MILGSDQGPRRDVGPGRRAGRLAQLCGGGRPLYCRKHGGLVRPHTVGEAFVETGVRRIGRDAQIEVNAAAGSRQDSGDDRSARVWLASGMNASMYTRAFTLALPFAAFVITNPPY